MSLLEKTRCKAIADRAKKRIDELDAYARRERKHQADKAAAYQVSSAKGLAVRRQKEVCPECGGRAYSGVCQSQCCKEVLL